MAGAAAGEQNKAQPSSSSQRNRNSKFFSFTSNLHQMAFLVRREAPMCEFRVLVEEWITQWCDSDKTTIGCQPVGVSASQQVGFWPSLNWPHQASAFCCYCYSIQGRIDKHKFPLWQMDFLWKQMGFLWKKQRCYPRISPTHTCTPTHTYTKCF